jgi:hypothetical protein
MFRDKPGRFMSGMVWQKSENAKRKHLKVELTADTESAAKKLQRLEVGVADGRGNIIYAVSGRRVVELGVLPIGLDDSYTLCRVPLSLSNVCEQQTGIGEPLVHFV